MDDVTSERTGEVGDSWAQVLAKLEAERGKVHAQEVTGRGARRKAAPSFLPEVSAHFRIVGSELTGSLAELGRRHWIRWFECREQPGETQEKQEETVGP